MAAPLGSIQGFCGTGECGSPSCGIGALSPQTQLAFHPAARDLFAVAIEVQRMIECNGFKPIDLAHVYPRLSSYAKNVLITNAMTLQAVLSMHPELVSSWLHEGCPMISSPGSPWLGPGLKAPVEHGPTGPRKEPQQALEGIQRGKAVGLMEQLTEMPPLQDSLRDIAKCLITAPDRTMLVSQIGNLISAETRSFLRSVKLRTAQLVRCFPNDFHVEEKGPASTITYVPEELKTHFGTPRQDGYSDNARHARLLKLAADVTMQSQHANGISAGELLSCMHSGSCLLVDMRMDEERHLGIIPGAVPVTSIPEIDPDQWDLIVAYCCLGCRSSRWCQELADAGIPGAIHNPQGRQKYHYLIGGVAAWCHQGEMFADPQTGLPSNKVHCWTWELAPYFPSHGYDVTCTLEPTSGGIPELNAAPEQSLAQASLLRLERLRDLAWEVRLRYCPSVMCFEAEDVIRSMCRGEAENYVFVDCRTDEEREVSTIAGLNCPVLSVPDFKLHAHKLVGFVIITFCTVGGRSGMFCERTTSDPAFAGLNLQMRSILGGIAAWLHAGGGLVDAFGMPSRRVSPWCQAFMDIFPVEGIELICNELQTVPKDAQGFLACAGPAASQNFKLGGAAAPRKILRTCQALAPEALADSLARAANACERYED